MFGAGAITMRDGARALALFAVLRVASLRRAELVALDLGDLDRGAWTMKVLGEGNKERRAHVAQGRPSTRIQMPRAVRRSQPSSVKEPRRAGLAPQARSSSLSRCRLASAPRRGARLKCAQRRRFVMGSIAAASTTGAASATSSISPERATIATRAALSSPAASARVSHSARARLMSGRMDARIAAGVTASVTATSPAAAPGHRSELFLTLFLASGRSLRSPCSGAWIRTMIRGFKVPRPALRRHRKVSPSGLAGHPIAPFLAFRTHRVRSPRTDLSAPRPVRVRAREPGATRAVGAASGAKTRRKWKTQPRRVYGRARGGPGRWRVRSTRKPSS